MRKLGEQVTSWKCESEEEHSKLAQMANNKRFQKVGASAKEVGTGLGIAIWPGSDEIAGKGAVLTQTFFFLNSTYAELFKQAQDPAILELPTTGSAADSPGSA